MTDHIRDFGDNEWKACEAVAIATISLACDLLQSRVHMHVAIAYAHGLSDAALAATSDAELAESGATRDGVKAMLADAYTRGASRMAGYVAKRAAS